MWKSYLALVIYLVMCVFLGLLISRIAEKECISMGCLRKADIFLHDMDSNVSPCDNFYKFVCGKCDRIRGGERRFDREYVWGEDLEQHQTMRLASFLAKSPDADEDRVLRVLKMIYKSCLDTPHIDKEGLEPILNNIHEAGGFPLVEGGVQTQKRTKSNLPLDEIEFDIRFTGFSGGYIFNTYVDSVNEKGKESFYVHISPPTQLKFIDTYFDDYYNYVKEISLILNSSFSESNYKEINETLNFKSQLSKLSKKFHTCSKSFDTENLKEFSKEHSFLGLDEFLKNMLPYIHLPEHIKLAYNSRGYFTEVKLLLDKTPERIVLNYLIIECIMEASPMLPTPLRNAHVKLMTRLDDPQFGTNKSREVICASCIKESMSSAVSSLFLREEFGSFTQPSELSTILVSLKRQMRVLVNSLAWMDKKTKKKALRRIKRLRVATPFPEEVFNGLINKTAFRLYYEDLCFTGEITDILSSFLNLRHFKTDRSWELLEREIKVFDDQIDIFSTEINFDKKRNVVGIPMDFLKFPVFNRMWPNYLNYGGFCSKMAMELFRGIVPHSKGDWWSTKTKAGYEKHTRCLMDQYNDYLKPYTNTQVRDPNCMEDMVIALAGVNVASRAYVKYHEQRFFGERLLPGLGRYSSKELFFMDFASFHCDVQRNEYDDNMTEKEAASKITSEFKVNGCLKNMNHFSEIFGCSSNEFMSPTAKCNIWNGKRKIL